MQRELMLATTGISIDMISTSRILLLGLLILLLTGKNTQGATEYDDVAIVININSSQSVAIGEYFKNARSLPPSNIIYVNTSTAEEIDSAEFASLRSQIESYLSTNNLTESINYIVTTKGVPLKVNRGNTYSTSSPSSSVESELALLLGPYSSSIGTAGRITSPYYYQTNHFSRSQFGIYLVTRLDGYELQQVYDMIDRSGPGVQVSQSSRFVLDQDPAWNSSLPSLNNNLAVAQSVLEEKGMTVVLNATQTYETGQPDVIGYVSWGSNDHYAQDYTQYAIPHNTWSPGSLVETYVSTSGRSFQNPPTYGQSLVADLVAEGAAGAKGYVYEPFSSSMAVAQVLFDRYTSGYNLAESYYMSSRYLSWMDVVVGDPKTTIQEVEGPLPVQLQYLTASFVPVMRSVKIIWGTVSETNNYGFFVQRRQGSEAVFADLPGSFIPGHSTTLVPQTYTWADSEVQTGTIYYRLRQIDLDGSVHYSDAEQVTVTIVTGVKDENIPDHVSLAQNYPNPFNPTTTITYQLPQAGPVTVKVYTALGQEVTTLVDDYQSAGTHSVTFTAGSEQVKDIAGLSSAVYYYRIQAGTLAITKKMILVK